MGTSPVTGSRDKRSGTPGTSRAASPGLFLPPQSRAAPALRPNSLYRQMPGSTPRPPPASPTPQNPHGQDPMHHPLVPGGVASTSLDLAFWPQAIFILSGGKAQSSAIQGAVSYPRELICPQGATFQVAQVDSSDRGRLSPRQSNLLVLHPRLDPADILLASWGHLVMFVPRYPDPMSQLAPN